MTTPNETALIPLNRLVPSKANVRRTARDEGLAELVASIAAHGLRQNLNVTPHADGRRYEVVAGGRRLRALKLLAKDGRLAKDAPVACRVLTEAEDPTEISLVENALRVAMHPDDQFEAFHQLVGKGMGLEDVAARFGVTPALVERRLKLAKVSPVLRALYRKGEVTLEQMMAFAISDDHTAQEQAWQDLPSWNRTPRGIRMALTEETVPLSEPLARFVGIEAYVAAGGVVLRDLFDDADAGYMTDAALLARLATVELTALQERVLAEGWTWVRIELERDHSVTYRHVYPQEGEDEAEVYAAEDMARAGARLSVGRDGQALIERGLVHPDDWMQATAGGAQDVETPINRPEAEPGALPASLVEDLTAHRTAALRLELSRQPAVALAATVHALALPLLYAFGGHGAGSCLALRASSEPLERHVKEVGDSPAHAALDETSASWRQRLPENPAGLWAWCVSQPQEVLLDLLAFVAALSIDAVQAKSPAYGSPRNLGHADQLADALVLDMTRHWTPSVDGFYGRLTKAALVQVVSEAKAPMQVSIGTLKKPDAARHVAQAMAACPDWLPVPLRSAVAVPVDREIAA